MKIIDDNVLKVFRQQTRCEWCGRTCPEGTDPHHYFFKRGMGGGSRLDHPYNLVSLCRGFTVKGWVSCHDEAERGEITKFDLLAVVAAREGKLQPEIERELWRLYRLPKGSKLTA